MGSMEKKKLHIGFLLFLLFLLFLAIFICINNSLIQKKECVVKNRYQDIILKNSISNAQLKVNATIRKQMIQVLSSMKFLQRDYIYYECKDRRRLGGFKKDAWRPMPKNELERFDGAWFVCFDGNLAPVLNKCTVLSFGIDWDDSFDFDINTEYGCTVHSFDPFKEATRFTKIREKNPELKDSLYIDVNRNWRFYSLGVTGSKENIQNPNKRGGIDTLENILERFNLKNKLIDVFKVDIEGSEENLLANLDIDYACKYFKQFMIETHIADLNKNLIYVLLRNLEQCFSLFHRDSRLIGPNFKGETFLEENKKKGFKINTKYFEDENMLSKFLISAGELYFINENFLD